MNSLTCLAVGAGCLPRGLSSFHRLQWTEFLYYMMVLGVKVEATRLGLRSHRMHFCCIHLAKANRKASLDSTGGEIDSIF